MLHQYLYAAEKIAIVKKRKDKKIKKKKKHFITIYAAWIFRYTLMESVKRKLLTCAWLLINNKEMKKRGSRSQHRIFLV